MENTQHALHVGFPCPNADCGATVEVDIVALPSGKLDCACKVCNQSFSLDADAPEKIAKIGALATMLADMQGLLRECSLGVATPAGEVKVPFALALTQLKNLIQLNVNGEKRPFSFWTTKK